MTRWSEGTHYRWEKRWCWLWWRRQAVTLADYDHEGFLIPAGFIWNGPSVGRATPSRMRASCVHDALYRLQPAGVTQLHADQALRRLLIEDGAYGFAMVCAARVSRVAFWIYWRWGKWLPG